MTAAEIWQLPVDQRLAAFVERYKDLGEHTGCRSEVERAEMQEIAEAILPELLRARERADGLFRSVDLELNALKAKYSQALIGLDELRTKRCFWCGIAPPAQDEKKH